MANYRIALHANLTPQRLFTYMATFSNAIHWDPEVQSASELSPGIVQIGSSYQLEIKVGKKTLPFTFAIVEFDPPTHAVLESLTKTFYIRNTVEVRPAGHGSSELAYESTVRFRGFAAILNGFLFVPLRRIGHRARLRLRSEIETMSTSSIPPHLEEPSNPPVSEPPGG